MYSNGGGYGGNEEQLEQATCFCSLGAIREAYRRRDIHFDGDNTWAAVALSEVLGREVDVWNDEHDRTHADVVEAFARASEWAKAHDE